MKKTEVLDSKCPMCGSKIVFNPTSNKWICKHCDNSYTLDEIQKSNNVSNKKGEEEVVDNYDEYFTYTCKNCGAEIISDAQTTATFCVYCGNTAILKNKLSGSFTPSKIIPFKKEKKDVEDAFKKITHNKYLVPKGFGSAKNIKKITGVYVPFWFHSYTVGGELDFNAESYLDWNYSNQTYTTTKVFRIERAGNVEFESIPIDGSTKFDDALMNSIQPYDYNELVPYNHAYLSGFFAERFDEVIDKVPKEVEIDLIEKTKEVFYQSVNLLTPKSIISNDLKIVDHKKDYVLLPVYMLNIKYAGKIYTFAMNGQTGEFVGDIPVDRKKAVVIFCLLFIFIFIIFYLILYIFYKTGGNLS